MNELHELKDMLCDELKKYGKKDMTAGSLDVVDKLSHTIKNLDKIIKSESEGYSGAYMPYRGGNSYARRDSMGRYSRDGGYSRHDDMIGELRYLMNDAKDDRTRMEFQRFIEKMEQM